ncbi:alpha/beta hydrolase-fold protein [Aquimarina sp. M1]
MINKTGVLFIILFLATINIGFTQKNRELDLVSNGETSAFVMPQIQVVPIKDTQTEKQYELYIELPEDYAENTDKRYPVLYYTDAMWHLEMLSGASEYMLEDVILVGISWQKDIASDVKQQYGVHASRFTDYSFRKKTNPNHPKLKFGQAENHVTFIRNNVITYVEKNYRTCANSRSYFGYSLSGAFGAYILLTQPNTFNNYILGSPMSKNNMSSLSEINAKLVSSEPDNSKKLHANVFIAHGNLEEGKEELTEEFLKLFNDSANLELTIQNKTIEGNHQTAFPRIAVASVAWLSSIVTHVSSDTAEVSFWDIPHLNNAFISTAPEDRDDGIPVGELSVDSNKKKAILNVAQEIFDDRYGNYDALLIAHKNRLVFESYYKKGRINLPHGQASAVKGYTSLVLGRAIQMGYLSMEDLDKPLVHFLKDVDPKKFTKGFEKITLHKALTMQGGLTIDRDKWKEIESDSVILKGQGLVQNLLEYSEPITDASQTYLYGNFNPMLVMTVIDAVVPGTAEYFIKTELLDKLGITNYKWSTHVSGLPQAGWKASLMSRDMLKFGNLVLNNGKWNGEQLISVDYLAKVTSGIVRPAIDWMPKNYLYGYFWYYTPVKVGNKSYDMTLAWGGGGQRVMVVKELDLTIVISGHDGDDDKIMKPVFETLVPAFVKQ